MENKDFKRLVESYSKIYEKTQSESDIHEVLGGQAGDGYIGHPRLGIQNPLSPPKPGTKKPTTSSNTGLAGRLGNRASQIDALMNQSYEPEGDQIDELNAGPSTPVKYDSHMNQLVPNQGAGRPGEVRIKKPLLQQAGYEPEGEMVDEGKQPFPAKKVAKQMEKARQGSVYGRKTENKPNPNVSDSEKKNTTRFSKMFHASEKSKREKQDSDKASRSSTFYKDTHPASAPKMKKANEEVDIFDTILEYLISEGYAETNENAIAIMSNMSEKWRESIVELNRVEREQGKKSGGSDDQAFRMVKQSIRKMEGTPVGQRKKVPGAKPPKAGEYGGPRSPAQKVAMRRASVQRSQDSMSSRFD